MSGSVACSGAAKGLRQDRGPVPRHCVGGLLSRLARTPEFRQLLAPVLYSTRSTRHAVSEQDISPMSLISALCVKGLIINTTIVLKPERAIKDRADLRP